MTAFTMMFTIKPTSGEWTFAECETAADLSSTDDAQACFGTLTVFRMTFALCVFHFLILVSILPRNNCAAIVHDAGWCFKFVLLYVLFGAMFYVPIEFFWIWGEISRWVSLVFFLLQVLYILVGAYTLGEHVVSGETASEGWRNGVLFFYTLILTAVGITGIVTSFIWF